MEKSNWRRRYTTRARSIASWQFLSLITDSILIYLRKRKLNVKALKISYLRKIGTDSDYEKCLRSILSGDIDQGKDDMIVQCYSKKKDMEVIKIMSFVN